MHSLCIIKVRPGLLRRGEFLLQHILILRLILDCVELRHLFVQRAEDFVRLTCDNCFSILFEVAR